MKKYNRVLCNTGNDYGDVYFIGKGQKDSEG